MPVMTAGAVARNSATKYQINYKMSLLWDWTFSPQFLFNLCLFGNIELGTNKFKSVFFEPDIEIPANKAKAISIKANFSKKISKRVSFHQNLKWKTCLFQILNCRSFQFILHSKQILL
jgi:hypothetical protein